MLKEKSNKNGISDEDNVLLIACYEKPYSETSLEMIKGTIKREKPTKIIILKIIEVPEMKDKLDTRIGKKTKENFIDSVVKDKRDKVDDYTEDVLDITDQTDIPTIVRMRKGGVIADEIVKDYEKMDVDHIIIHDNDRDLLDRLAKGKVKGAVEKRLDNEEITALE